MNRSRILFFLIILSALLIIGAGMLIRYIGVMRHYEAGVLFQRVQDWDAAETEFTQVVALNPNYKDVQDRLREIRAQRSMALNSTATPTLTLTAPPTSTSTPTPTSTCTPTPTPTPTFTPIAIPLAKASAENVPLYDGPSAMLYRIVEIVRSGETWAITGRYGYFWQICCVKGESAWVKADQVETNDAARLLPENSGEAFSMQVALQTFHGRYVTAMDGAREDAWAWALRAEATEIREWEKFELHLLPNDIITLRTHLGQYVTAHGVTDHWRVRSEPFELIPCSQFALIDLGEKEIALKTCYDRYWTAKDGAREDNWAWAIVGEAEKQLDWERFRFIFLDRQRLK